MLFMKKEKKGLVLLCLSYALYYVTLGVYSPFLNIYYERIGLNGFQIGLISSCGLLMAMLISPLWGALTDRKNQYKRMIAFLMLSTALIGLIWKQQQVFLWVFVLSLLLNIFRSNIGNLYDGFSIQFCKENQFEYSLIRSMGSLGYLVGAFLIGNLMFEVFKIQGPYMIVLSAVSVFAIVLLYFVKDPIFPQVSQETNNLKNNLKELLKNKDYLLILILCFFSIHAFDSANGYMGNHLVATLHFPDSSIGLVTCAMVLPEILIVMKIHVLLKKLGLKKAFLIATVAQVIRCIIYATSSTLPMIILASVVHGIMIGVGTVGVVSYIHEKVPSYMLATAMSVYGAFTVISYAIQAQLFGIIYQQFGSHMIFILTALFSCVAFLIAAKTKRL